MGAARCLGLGVNAPGGGDSKSKRFTTRLRSAVFRAENPDLPP